MNQTLLTAGRAAAPSALQGGAPAAGAWAQLPLPSPGVFRIRPLAFEATASYLERVAGTYRLTLPQLLDSTGITIHGHGTPPTAELDLSPTAARRVAVLSRIPMTHLAHALPHLVQSYGPGTGPAAACWKPLDAEHRPVAACTLCTWHHNRGTTGPAWIHRPWHRLICVPHQQAAPDPRLDAPVRTAAVTSLTAAHHAHQRLRRHPRGTSAWMTARAITTRWYDHQQHLTDRWHRRLRQLIRPNPHLDHAGNASPVLLARDLVIYPETVTLARTLATLPHQHPAQPTCDTLTEIGHKLSLTRFTPTTSDPLHTYLTRTHH